MKSKLIAGAAGIVLVAGTGLGLAQTAQADTLTATASDSPSATPDETSGRHDGRGGKGFDVGALAARLGLPEATVSDALIAVRGHAGSATRPSAEDATQAERDAARTARQSELASALATELNIDETTVTTALTDVRTEKKAAESAERKASLDQAVTDGTLTQAEADAVQKAIDTGVIATRDHGGHGGR